MGIPNKDTPSGFAFAIGAYGAWGALPLYLKAMDHVPALEIVAHRVLWSIPVAALVLLATGRVADLRAALRDKRQLAMAGLTAALVSINWLIYVWAISIERTVDAALGYYINPLFSVALGAVLLGERLTRTQSAGLALAAVAVLILTLQAGSVPWIALSLTLSWGFYAFFKRKLAIGPNQGFMLEVLMLAPFALAYLAWIGPANTFPDQPLMFMAAGVVTAVPLMLYANGAKGLRLSTIAILQYIAPSLILLVAVFVFQEPVDPARQIAFPLIWIALAIFSWSAVQEMRKPHAEEV